MATGRDSNWPGESAQRSFDFGPQVPPPARQQSPREEQGGSEGVVPRVHRTITIGAVTKALEGEFPDISISKIRYLEDQKLLTPQRTAGGYRLYTAEDVERLRTILRLQRDEFLPLRVIRQEMTGAHEPASLRPTAETRVSARPVRSRESGRTFTAAEVAATTESDPRMIDEMVEYGLIEGIVKDGQRQFDENDVEIVRETCELAQYGVGPRNLRVFRTSADREAALIQSIIGAPLSSRNPERRQQALEALDHLADVSSRLRHSLLIQDLRKIIS